MRIALIASSLRLAGAEKQFCYLARALSEAGLDVRVFYLGASGHYQTVLTEAGIPLRQIFNRDRPLLMLLRLIKELIVFKPHIVLASQFGDLIFAGPAGRLCNAFVLAGIRSDGFYEQRTSGWRWRPLLKSAHGLIANSQRAKDNLISQGVDAQRIAVAPNVIDILDFDKKAAMPFVSPASADCALVTAVGSLDACKRFDRFLDGLALARQREPRLFGVVAGQDVGEKLALEGKAKTLGLLPGYVVFPGECNHVPSLLAHSRLLVSCSEYEGFPNVILEAMAARLPVLATAAGDAGRIVKDGTTGYLLNADDPYGMADCIVRLISDPELARRMGEAGRKQVEEEYNLKSLATRLLSVFSDFARKQRRVSLLRMLERKPTQTDCPIARISAGELPASAT